jgi:hypothetical protein
MPPIQSGRRQQPSTTAMYRLSGVDSNCALSALHGRAARHQQQTGGGHVQAVNDQSTGNG